MSILISRIRKFVWSFSRRGFAGTLQMVVRRLLPGRDDRVAAQHPFDLQHGTDTSGFLGGTALLTGHHHDAYNTAYWAVSPSRARDLLRRWRECLPERNVEAYTFVDLGCGKGRMLMIASELNFREVIGVELHPQLAAIASANSIKWAGGGFARCPIRVQSQDAADIVLPDFPCVLFLYNPFGPPVLKKLLDRLEQHFANRPGQLDILYLSPDFESVFQQRPGYHLLWKAELLQVEGEPEDVVAPGTQACSAYRRIGTADE
jgi:SAM-dependent methyltransferase